MRDTQKDGEIDRHTYLNNDVAVTLLTDSIHAKLPYCIPCYDVLILNVDIDDQKYLQAAFSPFFGRKVKKLKTCMRSQKFFSCNKRFVKENFSRRISDRVG